MPERAPGPRKVIVGTAMHNMFVPYPGLEVRLGELAGLVDRMAEEAATRYSGSRLDIAVLPENAVNGGQTGSAAEISYPLEGPVLEALGGCARKHGCYVAAPLYLVDNREKGLYSNAVVLLDRNGEPVGTYRKVFAVIDSGGETAEGGVTPGTEFSVIDCDFGRVGIQICYDMAFDEGWEVLRSKGAELIIWPSQWPGQINPASRALRGGFFILSSTWRNNASLVDPTGHVIREIRKDGVFVEQIDLDYAILNYSRTLRNGAAFDEKYGAKAGYRYSDQEDCGIFWSNDPAMPIAEMAQVLNQSRRADQLDRARVVQSRLRADHQPGPNHPTPFR